LTKQENKEDGLTKADGVDKNITCNKSKNINN